MVQINCATLRGASTLATLFGQRRSHTGVAGSERSGLLHEAGGGVLFLDEVDELGLDEQAALLHVIETGRYYPLGSDHEVTSRFQVIAGTSRDPVRLSAEGWFRPDLLARLNTWSFRLPALRQRREDIEANHMFKLARADRDLGTRVGFNTDARAAFLRFASDPSTPWPGNFRDFSGAIRRLCTLAPRGRITRAMVEEEIDRLRRVWQGAASDDDTRLLADILGARAEEIDPFDRVQLAEIVRTCRHAASLSDAGRQLLAVSRQSRKTTNDADRLRKYLQRFGIDWTALSPSPPVWEASGHPDRQVSAQEAKSTQGSNYFVRTRLKRLASGRSSPIQCQMD